MAWSSDSAPSPSPQLQLLDAIRIGSAWLNGTGSGDGAGPWPPTRAGALASFLYAGWYAAVPLGKPCGYRGAPFLSSLRAATARTQPWEPGWIAEQVSSAGRVIAVRGGERRLLWPGDYVNARRPGLPPPAGTPLFVVDRCDSATRLPGFWETHSRDWFAQRGTFARLYWNLQPDGAPALVSALTGALSGAPFCLKLPSEPGAFARTDAAVLYIPAAAFPHLRPIFDSVHARVLPWLSAAIPPLTKRLAGGLAAAETSWNASESFGQQRCRLVAQGIVSSGQRAPGPAADVMAAIDAAFRLEGLDLSRPWLQPSGTDHYEL